MTKDKLYGMSRKLFDEKQGLENYLSKKTNDLFDLQDEIILYGEGIYVFDCNY